MSGMPEEHQQRRVKIFQPAPRNTHFARPKAPMERKKWTLEYDKASNKQGKWVNPLMVRCRRRRRRLLLARRSSMSALPGCSLLVSRRHGPRTARPRNRPPARPPPHRTSGAQGCAARQPDRAGRPRRTRCPT
jgi:hypothetical protein